MHDNYSTSIRDLPEYTDSETVHRSAKAIAQRLNDEFGQVQEESPVKEVLTPIEEEGVKEGFWNTNLNFNHVDFINKDHVILFVVICALSSQEAWAYVGNLVSFFSNPMSVQATLVRAFLIVVIYNLLRNLLKN